MEYQVSQLAIASPSSLSPIRKAMRNFLLHLKDHVIPHARNEYQPHVLHHRTLALFSGLLVSVKIAAIIVTAFGTVGPAEAAAITNDNIFQLTNQSRKEYGIGALTMNQQLTQAAQSKANDMLAKGYFAHTSPDGKSPWDFIKASGYKYTTAGENLAVDFTCAECVEEAWMNSPGHKANILNKYFEEIGIGIAQGQFEGHNAIFVVQMFGTHPQDNVTPKHEPTVLKEAPAPVVTAPAPTASVAPKTPAPTKQAPKLIKPATAQAESAPVVPAVPTASAPVPPESLKILSHNFSISGNVFKVEVKASSSASKVLLLFGDKALMLAPRPDGVWVGSVPLVRVASSAVSVKAQSIQGETVTEQITNFSHTIQENYNVLGAVKGETIKVFGKEFDPKAFEHKFYLLFIALILTCVIVAIAVKRHTHHLRLVMNSSFVVVLAVMLWLG